MINKNFIQLIISIVLFTHLGCYSFKGGSVPSHLKTIAIPIFNDKSGLGEPGLRETFTNKTIERFRKDISLELTDEKTADAILDCTILNVRSEPLVIEAGETVTRQKITITINVIFHDMKLKRKITEKQLSNWSEWEQGGGYEQRQIAIENVIDKLTEDILLEIVSGW